MCPMSSKVTVDQTDPNGDESNFELSELIPNKITSMALSEPRRIGDRLQVSTILRFFARFHTVEHIPTK